MQKGTFEQLLTEVLKYFKPLVWASSSPAAFIEFLGSVAPGTAASDATQLSNTIKLLSDDIGALIGQDEPSPEEIFATINHAASAYEQLELYVQSLGSVDPLALFENIGDQLTHAYLARYHPGVLHLLLLASVIRYERLPNGSAQPKFNWETLGRLFSDTQAWARDSYQWGTPQFDSDTLLWRVSRLFSYLGLMTSIRSMTAAQLQTYLETTPPTTPQTTPFIPPLTFRLPFYRNIQSLATPGTATSTQVEIGIEALPAKRGVELGIATVPYVEGGVATVVDVTDALRLTIIGQIEADGGLGLLLLPSGVSLETRVSTDIEVGIEASYHPAKPAVLLGQAGKTRLELGGGSLGFSLGLVNGNPEVRASGAPQAMKFVIAKDDIDGFLRDLFGDADLVTPINFGIAWSNRTGFSFTGGAGLLISVHPHLELGPVRIDQLDLELVAEFGSNKPPTLRARGGIAFSAKIGPIGFSVEGAGVELSLTLQKGNAGPFEFQYGFLPPISYGLAIDANAVTGGGYLKYDKPHKRYCGAVHLEINGIGLTALGLLTTEDSSGQPLPPPGFSFLIIVTAKFPPIQLGYGFTLNEAGGLAGLHRTIAVEALQSGIREGSVDHVLFPADPINNAPQILSDLNSIFPVQANRYVFGPMAVLGWGTPTLIHIELGIIIELPAPIRIILLGKLSMQLPKPDAPVVKINVDILGIIDTGTRLISLDATLRDSTLAGFVLTGDMAMRLRYGDQPDFALAVGGFNPHFQPPPGFPALRRLGLAITFGKVARLSLQSYLALTANSLQLGASAELYAEAFGFNVHGWTSFDVLVIFSPFSFRADISAGCSLRHGQTNIAAISVEATLTGPTPYHIWGKGSVSVLVVTVTVPFDETFGERQQAEIPAKNPWDELRLVLEDPKSWSGKLGESVTAAVNLASASTTVTPSLIHPSGTVEIRQRIVPLNKNLERYGEYTLEGAHRYDIKSVTFGNGSGGASGAVTWKVARDYLAPALSENLTDDQKLSRPSFEMETVGIEAIPRSVACGRHKTLDVEYETKVIDSAWESRTQGKYTMPHAHQLAQTAITAKAMSTLANSGTRKFSLAGASSKGFALDDERYAIVSTEDLSELEDLGSHSTHGAALQALQAHLANNPEDKERLQVLPMSQIKIAA